MDRARNCPVCRREIPGTETEAPFRPFCSKRCKTIDLGSWLDGRYRISRPLEEQDLDGGVTHALEKADDDSGG